MKHRQTVLLVFLSLFINQIASGQSRVDQYVESTFSGSFTSAADSGATPIVSGNDTWGTFTLPFTFSYDNITWPGGTTTMTVNDNGEMNFGSYSINTCCSNCVGSSSLAPAAVLPFSGDYYVWGGIYSRVTGSTPNRVLTVEWYDYSPNGTPANQTNIEVKLYETSNVIEFLYAGHSYALGGAGGIGLNGSTSPSFLSKTSAYSATGSTPSTDIRWTPAPCNNPVTITSQPQNLTVCAGSNASFSVVATGSGLTYQWRKYGTAISGATSTTYSISSAQTSDAGSYDVVVSNSSCSATSSSATLSVGPSLTIVQQPISATVCSGQSAIFSFLASDSGGTAQWSHNGIPISGATHTNYTIASAQSTDAGSYSVTVTSACGSVTSTTVMLTVNPGPAPSITSQPTSLTLCANQNASFSVTASGTGLTYQWREYGVAISGAITATYSIPSAQTSDAGTYDVVVSNSSCSVTSLAVALSVAAAISFTQQPNSATVCPGEPVTFSFHVSNMSDTNGTIQWMHNGTPITGATGSSYTISSVQPSDVGSYTVVVTSMGCSATSSIATLALGNCIKGKVFRDLNSNGVFDIGVDAPLSSYPVEVAGSSTTAVFLTASDGTYGASAGQGSFTVSVPSLLYYTVTPVTPPTISFASPSGSSSLGNDFAFAPIANMSDLRVSLIGPFGLRAGRSSTCVIVYDNVGTTTETATLTFDHDLAQFTSSIPAMTDNSTLHQATLILGPLAPGAHGEVTVTIFVPLGTTVGSLLNFSASITISSTELTPADNVASTNGVIVNSHDPNAKHVSAETLTPTQVLGISTLTYTIEFQNTGTASAIDIILKDTLDSHLMPATFRMIAASHPYTVSTNGNGALTWTFQNIYLPDSTTNEHASHGFVTYGISPKSSLVLGDSITNRASIYFDFNAPVVTNKAVTLIARSASVGQKPSSGTLAVRVYPNPALGVAHINVEELPKGLPASVYVVDEAGEIVAALYEGTPSGDIGLRLSLDCAKLASGIYYVHVQNAVMGRAVRFVVMR